MEIPGHKKRFVIIAALDVYGKALAAAKKATENAHVSTSAVDEMVVILEHLKAEYQDAGAQLTFDGTPMGDALSGQHYKDDDGTDLGADALDDWLRVTAGAYVPIAVIAEWVLEKRKLVAAWLRGIAKNRGDCQGAKLQALVDSDDGRQAIKDGDYPLVSQTELLACVEDSRRMGRTCAPDFIDVAWFTPPTSVAELPLSTDDVDKWITAGPWGVIPYDAEGITPGSEWELVRRDGTDAAAIVDRSKFIHDDVEAARQDAAKRNRDLAEPVTSGDTAPADTSDDALHPE